MLWWILIGIAIGVDVVQRHSAYETGNCQKMMSVYVKIYLPEKPLVYLTVHISLVDLDGSLNEYPSPKPMAYSRYNGVPNEIVFDKSLALHTSKNNGYIVQETYPAYSDFIVIRIDGGLLQELHMFNAYSLKGWTYHINLKSYYCTSGIFTVLPWDYHPAASENCTSPILDINNIPTGIAPSMFYIPQGTAKFTINTTAEYSLSPYNYISNFIKTSATYINPLTGWWFLITNLTENTEFALEITECMYTGQNSCNNETIIPLSSISKYSEIPNTFPKQLKSTEKNVHIFFEVLVTDIKYRYAVLVETIGNPMIYYNYRGIGNSSSVCDSNNKLCKKSKGKVLAEFEYLQVGTQWVSVYMDKPSPFTVSIIKTEVGNKMCHGQSYFNYGGIVYGCFCVQNTAGFYCESLAISDSLYLTSVMLLTLSNLAMVPAVLYAINKKILFEASAYFANMVASYIYHFCDEEYFCLFNMNPYTLLVTDFILSFNSISVSIVYLARIQNFSHKFSLIFFILVLLMYLEIGSTFSGFFVTAFVISIQPLAIVIFITLGRYVCLIVESSKKVQRKWWSWKQFIRFFYTFENFRLRWVLLAFFSFALALTARGVEGNYNYYIVKDI